MSVFRVERNRNYTVMSNYHLRDRRLSLKAKGLLSQMLSLPEDWDYTLGGLAQINREKIDAIRAAVRELEAAGYVVRSRERDAKGRLRGADYVIYEQPQTQSPVPDSPMLENPMLENPTLDFPTSENPTQLIKINKIKNYKIPILFLSGLRRKKLTLPVSPLSRIPPRLQLPLRMCAIRSSWTNFAAKTRTMRRCTRRSPVCWRIPFPAAARPSACLAWICPGAPSASGCASSPASTSASWSRGSSRTAPRCETPSSTYWPPCSMRR